MKFNTATIQPEDVNDTSIDSNDEVPYYKYIYNRAVRRYAKKHNLSFEDAFDKLYENKNKGDFK